MNPFIKVTVGYDTAAHTATIQWSTDAEYDGAVFAIRKSPDGERNISVIGKNLGWGESEFQDEDFFIEDRTSKWFYQVIMTYNGVAYYSGFVEAAGRKLHLTEEAKADPAQQEDVVQQNDEDLEPNPRYNNTPGQREAGMARYILRREATYAKRRGTGCAILKPKRLGDLSHRGIDQDTNQEHNPNAAERFGEKYKGGFEPPVFTYLTGTVQKTTQVDPQQGGDGEKDKYLYQARALAQPHIDQWDIIVDLSDGARYHVHKIEAFQFRGNYTVVVELELILLDRSHSVYKFPVDPPPVIRLPWDTPPPDTPYDPDVVDSGGNPLPSGNVN